jgi:hypothetical protein
VARRDGGNAMRSQSQDRQHWKARVAKSETPPAASESWLVEISGILARNGWVGRKPVSWPESPLKRRQHESFPTERNRDVNRSATSSNNDDGCKNRVRRSSKIPAHDEYRGADFLRLVSGVQSARK